MENKIKAIRSNLKNIECNYNKPQNELVNVEVRDNINIIEIKDDLVVFLTKREIICDNLVDTYIKVAFETNLKYENTITKEQFINDVKKGLNILSETYSKISLMIAQMSELSPLGCLVTPPMYQNNKIVVE